MISGVPGKPMGSVCFIDRLKFYRQALLRSTRHQNARGVATETFDWDAEEGAFGTPASIAARYRFVQPGELRAALEQFCQDIGFQDSVSIPAMETFKVFHSSLTNFWSKRKQYFAPHQMRDTLGNAAAAFMAAQALAGLFEYNASASSKPILIPLVDHVMRRGAQGLYTVGIGQFDELAQICVDLTDWLIRAGHFEVVLIEAPLGNTVPVAVMARVAEARGVKVKIVEWGCPRNDRALNGRTVVDSAQDLAAMSEIAAAPFLLFLDDAITGSRFLKMSKALRRAVGAQRFGAVALRARFDPRAGFSPGQIRDLHHVRSWAKAHGMPFGEVTLPDLPFFGLDAGAPALLDTALAWGDAGHSAGKRKTNILFLFLDRFEAIARDLGTPGHSRARTVLAREVWAQDTAGRRSIIPSDIVETAALKIIGKLPPDFFKMIRATAKLTFPHDYYGRAIADEADLRQRTQWLEQCVVHMALGYMPEQEAWWLNRAINELSQHGYSAGIDAPPRDHDYGLYSVPMPAGEDRLHRALVDLIVANAHLRIPR